MSRAKKSLGQNFLHDPTTICRILEFGRIQPGESLFEIGPGRGALTRTLLEISGDLVALELDAELAREPLAHLFGKYPRARLLIGDVRNFDPRAVEGFGRRKVFGNLPYGLATHLILKYAEPEWRRLFSDMIFMVQREVADRIRARPRSRDYGYLSCVCQLAFEIEKGFRVSPAAFTPRPKVDSTVVRLRHTADWPFDDGLWKRIQDLLKQAFGQRRKTILNNLKGSRFSPSLLQAAGISPTSRPEEISVAQYVLLARQSAPGAPETAQRPQPSSSLDIGIPDPL